MTGIPIKILSIVCVFFILVIGVQHIKLNKANDTIEKNKIENLKMQSSFNKKLYDTETELKKIESDSYEKYTKLQSENKNRIDNLLATNNGLRIKINTVKTCPNKSTIMDDGKAGVGVIDTETSRRILELMQRADKYKSQLEALQNYISEHDRIVQE